MGGARNARGALPALGLALLLLATAGCTRYVRIDDLAEEYYNLGNAFYSLEEYEEAEQYYLRALELSPDFERASFNLARALAEQERFVEARALLEELLLEDPDNLQLREAIAYVDYQQGDVDAAVASYLAVLEVSPFRADALYNLGVLYLDREEDLQARLHLARAYEVAPNDPDVLRFYSEALFRTGREEEGLAILDELREFDDLPPDYLGTAARRYAEADYFADALVLYNRLLAEEPDDATAHFAKARILLTAAEEGDAGIAALEDALEAGFADTEAAQAVLAEPSLIRGDEVRILLEDIAGVEAGEEAPATEEAAGDPES